MDPAVANPSRVPAGQPSRGWGLALAGLWAFYLVLLWLNRERHEDIVAPLGVLPVVLTGLLLGPRLGFAGALLVAVAALAIHAANGDPAETMLQDVQQNAFRWGVGLLLGLGSGILAAGWRRERQANERLRQAQQRLQASEERFRLVWQATQDVVWDVDVATQHINWGGGMQAIFGYAPAALPDGLASWTAFLHPDDAHRVESSFLQALDSSATQWQAEYRFRRADGSHADVLDRGLIVRDAAGKAVRAVGAMTDVTAFRAATEAARVSEARWRTLAENAPAYILTCDPQGRITFVNRTVPGLALADVLGRPAWEFSPGDQHRVRDLPLGVVRENQPRTLELEGPGPHGSVRQYSMHWAPVPDANGAVSGLIAMAVDVTEQRRAQEAQELANRRLAEHEREAAALKEQAEFKTRFLSNAAHELATPLTPLKLQLATMRNSRLARADRPSFDLLERNVHRLGTLVNDLLDAARLQAGGLRLHGAPSRVPDLLQRLAASFGPQARAAGVTLGVRAGTPDVAIVCDELRIEQVLFNLVHNALKFTPRGGQVWLEARPDGQHIVLGVQDTGIGLEPTQVKRLFQPFSQVHDAAAVKAGGTGLGLYIARGIAQQHGGDLRVRSQGPGQGSLFELWLPLKSPLPADASSPENAEAPPRGASAPAPRPAAP